MGRLVVEEDQVGQTDEEDEDKSKSFASSFFWREGKAFSAVLNLNINFGQVLMWVKI